MTIIDIVFIASAFLIVYTFLGYPILLGLWARMKDRRTATNGPAPNSISIVLSVYNEEKYIERRLQEFIQSLQATGIDGEIIVVSDGSTDGTNALVRSQFAGCDIGTFIEMRCNVGKACALNEGVAVAKNPIVVFADARQTWSLKALNELLLPFADPAVGGVSGNLELASRSDVLGGVGLYWKLEKKLRKLESRVHSSVGVTGAICAVRRELFRPIPRDTILDDVYWPLCVVKSGYRVVFANDAQAYDSLPATPQGEFRRKVRTLSGNFQLATRLPWLLFPWSNPVWVQFMSHKICRLLVPWALITVLVASALGTSLFYRGAFVLQSVAYLAACLGLAQTAQKRLRYLSAASSFLLLNSAAWLAFWVWILGKCGSAWRRADYMPGSHVGECTAPPASIRGANCLVREVVNSTSG